MRDRKDVWVAPTQRKQIVPWIPAPAMKHKVGRQYHPLDYGRGMTFLCHHLLRCQWGAELEDWVRFEYNLIIMASWVQVLSYM